MKGLREYKRKYGEHFTEELAFYALYSPCVNVGESWSIEEIKEAAQKKVYYNVTGATSGDIIYMVNAYSTFIDDATLDKCVSAVLKNVGDYEEGDFIRNCFKLWVFSMDYHKNKLDLKRFIKK